MKTRLMPAVMIGLLLCQLTCGTRARAQDEPLTSTDSTSAEETQLKSLEEMPRSMLQIIALLYEARNRKFTPLDGAVEDFSVSDRTVPEAVANLSNQHNVLCGIEVIPWPPGPDGLKSVVLPKVSLSLRRASPRQILDALIEADSGFTWMEDAGLAVVVMRAAYQSASYPLNGKVSEFKVTNRPYTMVFGSPYTPSLFGLPQIKESLTFASSGRWPREFEPKITIDVANLDVRQIINQVAREVGMSWSAIACKTADGKDTIWFKMAPVLEVYRCGN